MRTISIKNSIKVEVYISDELYPGTYNLFREQFAAAVKDADEVILHINSPGGSVFEGQGIINTLKSSGKKITAVIDGVAASMAAIIALSANVVKMPRNTMLMLHAPSNFAGGNAEEFRKNADLLDKVTETLMGDIARRTGLTDDEITAAYFDGEDHWFTSQEALDAKLIDAIEEYDAVVPEGAQARNLQKVVSFFNSKNKSMKNEFLNKALKTLGDLKALLTGSDVKDSFDAQTTDGKTVTFDDPDGDGVPAVGDKVTMEGAPIPDGAYTLSDSTTITCVGGAVTEIGTASEETDDKTTTTTEDVTELKSQNEKLTGENTELKTQVQNYETQFKNFNTELEKQKGQISSKYNPQQRTETRQPEKKNRIEEAKARKAENNKNKS